jgi:hypothetical protein
VRLAADLSVVDVQVLVFKGIHLAFAVAPRPDFRLCLDADVLVFGDFERAAARLRALAGWQVADANWSTYGATWEATGAYVDLHRLVLPPRFGRFDVAAVRARARARPDVFGPRVLVPDPLDAAVLAIANHVKDQFGATSHGKIAGDLALLERYAGVGPEALAARLAEHGLRRVGLLGFDDLTASDSRWQPYRDACAQSPAELRALHRFAAAVRTVGARSNRLGFLLVRGVADRPFDAAASMTLASARLTRDFLFR